MVTIQNERILAEINPLGAELSRIVVDGVDFLWNGDPTFWTGRAPIMFPICGGLKDDKFIYQGKEYTLNKHGYAKFSTFTVEKAEKDTATFLLCSDEESRKKYPFDYEFRVTFALVKNELVITYRVDNKTDGEMYCSVGAHEAYACPEGIQDYDVIFPQKETLDAYELDGNLLTYHPVPILRDETTIALKYDYFAVDALVFLDVKSDSMTLRNRNTGRQVTMSFPEYEYLLLWTKPGAGYICMEPWSGIQDRTDSNYDITKKQGIHSLAKGESLTRVHKMTF